jgi:hypothetical protein
MWQSNQLPRVYDWFFFLGRFSAMTLPLLTVGSFRCHQRGRGDACCVAAGASWSYEGPISSYKWNIVVNFVRSWNKWQFRYVVTIFVPAEWRTLAVFKYGSTSVSSSLSSVGMCAPSEAPAAVCCARIGWDTSMPPMQLQWNASHQALLWILCKDINNNIINSMIHYDELGK